MGFEPTTFRTIGPRNIYKRDTRHNVVIIIIIIIIIITIIIYWLRYLPVDGEV